MPGRIFARGTAWLEVVVGIFCPKLFLDRGHLAQLMVCFENTGFLILTMSMVGGCAVQDNANNAKIHPWKTITVILRPFGGSCE